MKCAASELLTKSASWRLLEYSWLRRWKLRSAPERSTCTGMPGYFASNALATFSASSSSTEVYQTILPSFLAASMSSGVTFVGAGASASAAPAKKAAAAAIATPPANLMRMSSSSLVVPRDDRTVFAVTGGSLIVRTRLRKIMRAEILDNTGRRRHHAKGRNNEIRGGGVMTAHEHSPLG